MLSSSSWSKLLLTTTNQKAKPRSKTRWKYARDGIGLAGEAPGVLLFCPLCCQKTSCVTLTLAAWMLDDNNNTGANNTIRVNECQVCRCEFPCHYDFETMDATSALDYALTTAIIAVLSLNRSHYGAPEFRESDASTIQSLLGKYSTTLTYYTTKQVLDQARFWHHRILIRDEDEDEEDTKDKGKDELLLDWTKCLYPIVIRKLTQEYKHLVLRAIEGTANPKDADALVQQAAQLLFQNYPMPYGSSRDFSATAAVQSAVDEYHLWVHKGCQKLDQAMEKSVLKKKTKKNIGKGGHQPREQAKGFSSALDDINSVRPTTKRRRESVLHNKWSADEESKQIHWSASC